MNASVEKYFDRLIELLTKKQLLLKEMYDLTQGQSDVITADTLAVLQKLVDEKQLRIDAINKLDEEFAVFLERLKTTVRVKSLEELDASQYPSAARMKEITGETVRLIGKISELEKQNSVKSKELLSQIGNEIKKLNQGKKVNKAYAPVNLNIPSYFLDKKK